MYESQFGLREKPFSLLPDADFLFLTRQHALALSVLQYGLESQAGITVLTGEVGCGKTTLLRRVLRDLGDDVSVGLITNTHSSFGELLEWVLSAFSLEYRSKSKVERFETLTGHIIEQYAQNRRTVLIVDEAHNLGVDTLEELRMLSNINADKHQVLQLVLSGQVELQKTLQRSDLRQFSQRVSFSYHIGPLQKSETGDYIRYRLGVAGGDPELFLPETYDLIHGESGGVPRLINILCDFSLIYAYAERRDRITHALVEAVIHDRKRASLSHADTGGDRPGAKPGPTSLKVA